MRQVHVGLSNMHNTRINNFDRSNSKKKGLIIIIIENL
jgi:hypothetical protein